MQEPSPGTISSTLYGCTSCWISSSLKVLPCVGQETQELCWGTFYYSYLQPWKPGGVIKNVSAAGGHVTYGNLAVVAPVWSGGPVPVLGVQIFHSPEANKRRAHGSLAGGHERLKAKEPMAAANHSKNKPPVRLIVPADCFGAFAVPDWNGSLILPHRSFLTFPRMTDRQPDPR